MRTIDCETIYDETESRSVGINKLILRIYNMQVQPVGHIAWYINLYKP